MPDIKESVTILCNALKTDSGYYIGWQANIAMAMYDECLEQGSEMPKDKLHKICNDGAKRFLNQLINQ